jgi:hypothetical protein
MLNYEFPPLGGGAANACEYILREMAKRDIEVDLVKSSASNKFKTRDCGANSTIHELAMATKSMRY